MIEFDGEISFEAAVEMFLIMDEDEAELVMEQLEMLLAAADHAQYLQSKRTTH